MRKLEVFFDYACPYCLKGHEFLTECLTHGSDIEIIWCPCEAHPRPERYGMHSDLCIQGMYYALEQGVDIWEYHNRMYEAAITKKVNIEDPNILSKCVQGLLDESKFLEAITSGRYLQAVTDGNNHAYQASGVWAVPSYRMEGKKLDAVENIGVTKQQLVEFLK